MSWFAASLLLPIMMNEILLNFSTLTTSFLQFMDLDSLINNWTEVPYNQVNNRSRALRKWRRLRWWLNIFTGRLAFFNMQSHKLIFVEFCVLLISLYSQRITITFIKTNKSITCRYVFLKTSTMFEHASSRLNLLLWHKVIFATGEIWTHDLISSNRSGQFWLCSK